MYQYELADPVCAIHKLVVKFYSLVALFALAYIVLSDLFGVCRVFSESTVYT